MPAHNVELLAYLKRASPEQLKKIAGVMSVDSLKNCAYGSRQVSHLKAFQLEKATHGELSRKVLRDDWKDVWPELETTKKGKK